MKIKWNKLNRKIHYWGSIICALPVLIVIITGTILLLKKNVDWVQPPTMRGQGSVPSITFEQVLEASKTVPEAGVQDWEDIDRLDVRLDRGIIKVHATNKWEIQIDHQTKQVLQVAYRRSDLIESIHDGSFFHEYAKLGVFMPSAILLLFLSITGLYLFLTTLFVKQSKKRKKQVGNN